MAAHYIPFVAFLVLDDHLPVAGAWRLLRPREQSINGVDVDPFGPSCADHARAVHLLVSHRRWVFSISQVQNIVPLKVVGTKCSNIHFWNGYIKQERNYQESKLENKLADGDTKNSTLGYC